MGCDSNWTIQFLGVNGDDADPFEVRPITMSMKMSRVEYDFCRAKLPWDVGEMMKPHTRYSDGALYGYTKAVVCYNGEQVKPLVFRPDWVDYGSEYTHLQLHDLHKALSEGVVNEQRNSVELKKIYQDVVNAASNRFIDEIKFTLPEVQVRTLKGARTTSGMPWGDPVGTHDDTLRVVESQYAVDFDEISPELALRRLNKKYQLKSWVNSEGTLIVGLPESKQIRHIAAPNDERVWRYKDPSISHGREPLKTVIVKGSWVDEPGFGGWDVLDFFDEGGTSDVRAMGVGTRTDIDYGSRFTVKATGAKRDALPEVAELALKERMKQQNAGTIEIDPELSGNRVSDIIDVEPGDLLQLVPNDKFFDNPTSESGRIGSGTPDPDKVCGDFVNNETYLVSEVEHNVTESGEWQVHLDLGMESDVEMTSFMSYFDPESDTWVDNDEINDDGELKGGIFEIEDI